MSSRPLSVKQPIPRVISFVLFLAICASLAYWAIEFFTPSPRAVVTSPNTLQSLPPVSAAADLFGGKADANTMKNIQLRGVILAGRSAESVALLVPDGGTPKYLRRDAEVMPGVKVQEIKAKQVVLSDHGVSREVNLAAFVPASTNLVAPANTSANAIPAPAVSQATINTNEAGMPAVQNSSAAGSSGAAAVTATGVGNRHVAPANNATLPSQQITPQNAAPRIPQEPSR